MEFALTEDQRFIQDSARDFLAAAAGPERLREMADSDHGFDETLWSTLAGEMGFAGLMIPEQFGGSGLGAIEMALVLEETGRTLAAIPFFETAVLAAQAILAAGSEEQKRKWLPKLASGQFTASFAGIADRPTVRNGQLTGVSNYVTFGHVADLILVATDDDSLIAVPSSDAGLSVEALPTLDRTRRFARLTFDCEIETGMVLGDRGSARAAIERVLMIGSGLLAAEQTGGAQFCLDSTVEYAKQRIQFGRTIGSFQAIKHMLADMMLQIEASRSAALYAAAAIAEGSPELAEACSIARSWASDCFRHCSGEAIQIHGGIGFTWEHHAHLYFKRARATSSWLGTAEQHREKLASIILEESR